MHEKTNERKLKDVGQACCHPSSHLMSIILQGKTQSGRKMADQQHNTLATSPRVFVLHYKNYTAISAKTEIGGNSCRETATRAETIAAKG